MKHQINNLVNGSPVTIETISIHEHEYFVSIVPHAGGMRFRHTMTPAQAREMAEALIQSAFEAESMIEVQA